MKTSFRLPRSRERIWALASVLALGAYGYGCGGGGSDCGGPFCLGPEPGQATKIKLESGDGQTGAPGRELPNPIEVVVTDANDNAVQDVMVTFSVGQGGGSLSDQQVPSDASGRARANWTLGTDPGAQSAQATANGTSGSPLSGAPLTFSAQAVRPLPAKLVIRQAPSVAASSGRPLEQQPVIDVLDGDDQPVPQVQIVATIASGGGTLNGTTTVVSDGSGRGAYTDLALAGLGGPRTLRFSVADPALEVVSGSIILGAGGPAQIAGIPPLAYEGTVTSPVSPAPSVVVKDAAGNGVPGISVSFTANRDAAVSPETVPTDENGVAQVTSWTLGSGASGTYTLTARVEGSALPAVRFSATARAGAAGRLAITSQPSSPTQNGVAFSQQPVIQVTDQDGNPAPQANVQITATVSSGPNGDLTSATAMTDATGKATFTGLALIGTVGNYTISFSAEGLTGVTSSPITLTVGPPAMLAVAVPPPTTARSREVLIPQPVIQVQDAGGNPVAQAGIAILASVDGGATLGAQTTATTDANGRATFTGLAISGSPGLKTVSFNGVNPGLLGASAPVTLPNVASIELVTGAPATAEVGSTLPNVPVWVLKDFAGNPVADAPFTLAALAGGAPAGSVVPVSGTSDGSGTAQVQTWTLGTTAGDQYVEIRVTGTDLSSQAHLEATAAAAAQLVYVSGDNQTAPVNSTLPDPFKVKVEDQFHNGVPNVEVEWRACQGEGYNQPTDEFGFSIASQPTGPQPSNPTFCTTAAVPGLSGSPITFTYTVTAGSPTTGSQSLQGSLSQPKSPAPAPSKGRGVHPSPSR